ncbi:hypothetical protein WKW80_16200 [Variovorax humicola]|uniref:Uncharacterized protein n=1 Tax=Variovorax humicola TaxID=1769758 RepID=A0ABU8W0P5_9BURK
MTDDDAPAKGCGAGGIALSLVPWMNHDGMNFHAGDPEGSANAAALKAAG